MFTGIVEEKGSVSSIKKGGHSTQLSIKASKIFEDLKLGDSVAVDGVCLTVSSLQQNIFTADIMNETLNRSSLGVLKPQSIVNLERAMLSDGRLGGHIVTGHIDGVGKIINIHKDGSSIWYKIKASDTLMKYIIEKGSIAIDGISLTVASVENDSFNFSVIPHTAKETNLSNKKVGDIVNFENDIIGKYVEKFLSIQNKKAFNNTSITKELLNNAGF